MAFFVFERTTMKKSINKMAGAKDESMWNQDSCVLKIFEFSPTKYILFLRKQSGTFFKLKSTVMSQTNFYYIGSFGPRF